MTCETVPNGGYRATVETSGYHAARLAISSACDPNGSAPGSLTGRTLGLPRRSSRSAAGQKWLARRGADQRR
jgi:hypothetical protein